MTAADLPIAAPSGHFATQGATWDVVIVGAGSAGSLAALLCSRAGLKTLLVDKQVFPRHKVCGCCLNGRAVESLRRAGLWSLLEAQGAVPLSQVQIWLQGRSLEVPLPDSWSVSRSHLDQQIVVAAVQAGCTFRSSVMASVVPLPDTAGLEGKAGAGGDGSHPQYREVLLSQPHSEERVFAKVVLVCDGLGHPCLTKESGFQSVVRKGSRVGLGGIIGAEHGVHSKPDQAGRTGQASAESPSVHQIQMVVGRYGYVGTAPLETGQLNIAAALAPQFLQAHSHPVDALRSLFEEARVPVPDGLDQTVFRGTRPLTQESTAVAGTRLLILGDAAGYVEPFTGEGIAWAFQSAELAVPLAVQICQSGWREQIAEQWRDIFYRQVRSRRLICRMLSTGLKTPWLLRPMLMACRRFPAITRQLVARMNAVSPQQRFV